MLFSIITINFNNKAGLQKTLDSVIAQSSTAYEHIIIDGNSQDGSAALVEQHANRFAYWVSEPDRGVYDAMNKGIRKAKGEYLIFLNSGDCFTDTGVLQRCADFLLQSPGADVYYGDIYIINSPYYAEKKHYRHPTVLSLEWLKKQTINHQASLIKASLFRELGMYPEDYKMASDYWFFLKSFLYNKRFQHLHFPMVDYDFSGMSAVHNEAYHKEREKIWNALVPASIDQLLSETEYYRNLTRYRLVKTAIKLNQKLQSIKKKK